MAAVPALSPSLRTISLQAPPSSASSKPNHLQLPSTFTLSSLFGTRIAIQTSSPCRSFPHGKYCRAASATVSLSLPSTKPPAATPENFPKWSARAIKSFVMAELEARKLKYPNTGTEALLMGILVEGTSKAAKFLRANGITLLKVREEALELLGKSDMYFFSPEHPPLTEPAQKSVDWAVEEKLKSGEGGEITVSHLLLGIWSQKESAGHQILAALGFNDEKAKEVATLLNGDVDLSFKQQA
ncbi:ATP-dependent Clp protease ATP-binding subunit CLPT1, chloroplastic [Neltuma alba]|uniref:ATP-dependent Clp protease ATP-binding subunit CLPT1, chloroplastic n=1 Tax=Neltuma alba TaxID=207710 RepID=UPI0010A437FB|nr:ATP-dependent Clp protease ATP-binding subunit CLPT1, chloroplastic-like [Prosopis alba]